MRRAVCLLLLVMTAACRGGSSDGVVGVGAQAPEIDAASIVDGQRVRTEDLRGSGYLVNFWGSWCEPCKRELPRLAAQHASGTKIVGVAVKSSNRQARELLASSGATWPSATDPEGSIAARWGLAAGFPVTLAVDPTGRIRAKHFGELSDADAATLAALTR